MTCTSLKENLSSSIMYVFVITPEKRHIGCSYNISLVNGIAITKGDLFIYFYISDLQQIYTSRSLYII